MDDVQGFSKSSLKISGNSVLFHPHYRLTRNINKRISLLFISFFIAIVHVQLGHGSCGGLQAADPWLAALLGGEVLLAGVRDGHDGGPRHQQARPRQPPAQLRQLPGPRLPQLGLFLPRQHPARRDQDQVTTSHSASLVTLPMTSPVTDTGRSGSAGT